MNAVIYARYSSDKQTEQSIEGQLRVCHEFAERSGYTVLNEYIDRAISGTSDKRPAFLQMIEDANKKEFEYILVYKLDRFSRNKYDSVIYKHKLKGFGVKVISATEAISDSPEGRLVEGLLEMMAEMYSQDLSQKVKRGIRESLLKGNFIGGHIPFGYKVVDKKLVIYEEQAKILRYYFEQYASGVPKRKIADDLNNKGYKTYSGLKFNCNSLNRCLTNRKYTGKYEINGMVLDNVYPQIISEELFDKVQKMLKKRRLSPATEKAKEEFLLYGKAYCGYCGSNLYGASGTSKTGKTHHYYVCSKQYKQHKCKKKYERKDYLEWYVVEQTKLQVLNKDIQDKIAEKIYKQIQNSLTSQKIKEYELKIKQTDQALDKCFDMYLNASTNEMKKRADEKAKDLELLKKSYLTEISKLQLINKSMKSLDDIKNLLNLFIKGDPLDVKYQRKIINKFINAVYLYDDQIMIYYNLFDTKQISYIEENEDLAQIDKIGEIFDTEQKEFLFQKHRSTIHILN